MIKISRELKAGIAVLLVLLLFYWGFSYLKGRNLFVAGADTYYTTYQNISGLKKSSPVTIDGYTVGSVIDIYFNDDPAIKGNLVVKFTINEDVQFSKNSIARIYSGGIMSGKSLAIIKRKGGEIASSGDFLKGEVGADMISKLEPVQSKVESVLVSIDAVAKDLDQLLNDDAISELQSSFRKINTILSSLESTSQSIDVIVKNNDQKLSRTLSSVEATSQNLKVVSDSLAKVKLLSISKKLNHTLANLDDITTNINQGNGTAGKLIKDEKLYNNLESASKELEELLRDVKEHPKRFVHFSLFGKKAESYEESQDKK
ncbi:MlaD family protein [Wenyingzhuangia sp. IMCC45533]